MIGLAGQMLQLLLSTLETVAVMVTDYIRQRSLLNTPFDIDQW